MTNNKVASLEYCYIKGKNFMDWIKNISVFVASLIFSNIFLELGLRFLYPDRIKIRFEITQMYLCHVTWQVLI